MDGVLNVRSLRHPGNFTMEIKHAVRRALPLQIGMFGPTGSGKTMSALMFAAGLVQPGEKVCIIDSERGRASLYADNKKVLAAIPGGYDVIELGESYHPKHYVEALDLCEHAGYKACIIDSESDSWDGPGGCTDIAEADKGRWNKAKLANKRMKTRISLSGMHCISLFKAQEKSKIIDKKKSPSGKEEVVSLGVLPICEKNAFYPMLLGFSIDPLTHLATAVKCHDDLLELFSEPKLLTKQDGERVRLWNESAVPLHKNEQLFKRARSIAEDGIDAYKAFFAGLPKDQQKALADSIHGELKEVAANADRERSEEVAQTDGFAEPVPV